MSLFLRLLAWLLFMLGLYQGIDYFTPRDDSDPPGARSGLGLRTDAKTGCQYFSRALGGVTPRLDAEGRQICVKP